MLTYLKIKNNFLISIYIIINTNLLLFTASLNFTMINKDILKDLNELLIIKSLPQEAEKNAPFGKSMRQTLDWFLAKAKEYGLNTHDGSGYYGWAELSNSDKNAPMFAVLAHLDVVGVNETEWSIPPFALTNKDGNLYGRGVVDNKGPAVVMLHVLKKIKDKNTQLKHRIRLICGCNEESGSKCLKHYAEVDEIPSFCMVPDADFPCINSEKGIMHFTVSCKLDDGFNKNIAYLYFGDKTTLNVIPDTAKVVANNEELVFKGIAGHAMNPDKGDNAAWKMFEYLSQYSPLIEKIFELFCNKEAKKMLNIDYSDRQSGILTMSLNHGEVIDDELHLSFDMRLPISANKDEVLKRIEKAFDCTTKVIAYKHNLFIDENSPLVQTFLKVYRESTGESLRPVQTGGGTYARELPNAVAFGPTFPNIQTNIHNKDECISEENFEKWLDIYYKAILELDKTSL